MKKIIKRILIYSVLMICCMNAMAQSSVRIYDLLPGTEIDSAVSSVNKVKLFINFKIVNVDQADSVFFMFGTTPGGAEITKETGEFKKSGSKYSVKTQGPTYPIVNNEASCRLKISSADYTNSTYLSLVVKDKTGLLTNVLNLRLK